MQKLIQKEHPGTSLGPLTQWRCSQGCSRGYTHPVGCLCTPSTKKQRQLEDTQFTCREKYYPNSSYSCTPGKLLCTVMHLFSKGSGIIAPWVKTDHTTQTMCGETMPLCPQNAAIPSTWKGSWTHFYTSPDPTQIPIPSKASLYKRNQQSCFISLNMDRQHIIPS